MIGDPSPGAKTSVQVVATPWTEHSESWRELDEKLPHDHLAWEIRDAMIHLDLAPALPHLSRSWQSRSSTGSDAGHRAV